MSSSTLKTLRLSLLDAFLYNIMVGVGESYLPAYVLSIGMSEMFAGILASLPLVSGAFLQLFTPKGLQKVGSHKSWVVGTSVIQALAFLPLIYFSDHGAPDFWTLFIILTLYWGASFSAGPAWTYWMGQVVPGNISHAYFSKRARVAQIGLLIGLVAGGVALHTNVDLGPFSSVFGGIFFLAFLCRFASSLLLSRHHFEKGWARATPLLGVRQSVKVFFNTGIKRKFFLYFLPLQIAVHVSAPFVTPFLLAQVKLDYQAYMYTLAAMLVGKIMTLTLLGRLQEGIDPFKLFTLGVIGICPTAMLWSLSDSYYYLIFLQLSSGVAWACLEVGLSLIFFRDLKQEEKVPILTVYNLLNATGIIVGAAFGAKLITWLGTDKAAYFIVFSVGGALRFIFAFFLIRVLRDWQRNMYPNRLETGTAVAVGAEAAGGTGVGTGAGAGAGAGKDSEHVA